MKFLTSTNLEFYRACCCFIVYLDLAQNRSLNKYLLQFNSDLLLNKSFGLQHFTYNNSALLDLIFNHLTETDVIGLTVRYFPVSLKKVPDVDVFTIFYF